MNYNCFAVKLGCSPSMSGMRLAKDTNFIESLPAGLTRGGSYSKRIQNTGPDPLGQTRHLELFYYCHTSQSMYHQRQRQRVYCNNVCENTLLVLLVLYHLLSLLFAKFRVQLGKVGACQCFSMMDNRNPLHKPGIQELVKYIEGFLPGWKDLRARTRYAFDVALDGCTVNHWY